jgi:hypothetical protein
VDSTGFEEMKVSRCGREHESVFKSGRGKQEDRALKRGAGPPVRVKTDLRPPGKRSEERVQVQLRWRVENEIQDASSQCIDRFVACDSR